MCTFNKKQMQKNEKNYAHRFGVKYLTNHFIIYLYIGLRILTGKKHPKIKCSVYEKYEYGHLGRWYIKLTLFKRF